MWKLLSVNLGLSKVVMNCMHVSKESKKLSNKFGITVCFSLTHIIWLTYYRSVFKPNGSQTALMYDEVIRSMLIDESKYIRSLNMIIKVCVVKRGAF